jgi:AraC-like DNA-binding protein
MADDSIARVVALMRENIAKPLSLEEMCKAAHLSPFHFDRVFRRATGVSAGALFAKPRAGGPLHGSVHDAPSDDAFVWIGVFPKEIPQSRPVSGALRRGNGVFSISAPADGRYDVLCASLAPTADWRKYLFSGDHLRVASTGTVSIADGRCSAAFDLRLRPLQPIDPPILAPLPPLAF